VIRELGKRTFDLILVIPGLVVLLPFLLCIALAIRFKLGVPVFFIQERPGFGGKPFKLYKFRTMTDARDNVGNLLPDVVRLTSFGYGMFSRAT
jgi:sugar transferase EpsL